MNITGDDHRLAADASRHPGDAEAPGSWAGTFGPRPDEVKRVRVAVRQVLTDAGVDPAVVADTLLIASELAGNAIRHARTDFTVSTAIAGGSVLRIEVCDFDSRPPALVALDSESTGGRGLHVVAGIARDWGWHAVSEHGMSGKVVWAEMSLEGSALSGVY